MPRKYVEILTTDFTNGTEEKRKSVQSVRVPQGRVVSINFLGFT